MPEGHADLRVAAVWVESARQIDPGGRGIIRLSPLSPEGWWHLKSGDTITMHEGSPVGGTAAIIEVEWPRTSP
ncbi:hypothetical protein ABZ913_31755, partial [Streptosporangium sandarakinum]